ncbi:MAG TPA: FAD binding domain-containing protein [Actinomycetota bacterium]
MEVLRPRGLQEALAMKAAHPEARPIAGGTDLMVELNFDRDRPEAILDLWPVPELREHGREDGRIFLGAGVTFTRIMRELPELVPLFQASRTVGSPQIRNRGTIGGNLGTASPAGDALPVLAAYDAEIVVGREAADPRSLPWSEFLRGPKQTALGPEELILGVRFRPPRGPGSFSKIGVRNAMVISAVGLCLVLDEDDRAVRFALGSVGPTIIRAAEAEALAARAIAEAGAWESPAAALPDGVLDDVADLVARAARPIDDVRGTAAYRRHACRVLARRALTWSLGERATGAA